MLERGDQLSGIEPRRVLVQFTGRLLLNVCAQVAAGREFRHEIVHGSALQAGVKLNRYRFSASITRYYHRGLGNTVTRDSAGFRSLALRFSQLVVFDTRF